MEALAAHRAASLCPALPVAQPRASPAAGGSRRAPWPHAGLSHWVRCYDVLPGSNYSPECGPLPDATLKAWGGASALLGRALRGFTHAAATRRLPWDVQHAAGLLRPLLQHVSSPRLAQLCSKALERFDRELAPALPLLRHQVTARRRCAFSAPWASATPSVTNSLLEPVLFFWFYT